MLQNSGRILKSFFLMYHLKQVACKHAYQVFCESHHALSVGLVGLVRKYLINILALLVCWVTMDENLFDPLHLGISCFLP